MSRVTVLQPLSRMSREVTGPPRRSRSEGPVHREPAQPAPAASYQSGADPVTMLRYKLPGTFGCEALIKWVLIKSPRNVDNVCQGHVISGQCCSLQYCPPCNVTGPPCRVQTAVCPGRSPGRSPEPETPGGEQRAGRGHADLDV